MNRPLVIDLSYVQRNRVDFEKVAAAGVAAAYIKCSEGNAGKDPAFRAMAAGFESVGIPWGAYHFARPSSQGDVSVGQDAIAEIENLYGSVLDLGPQLKPVLDLESTKLVGKATLAWAETWIWLCHEYHGGIWPVGYSGAYFLESIGAPSAAWLTNLELWLAAYPIDPVKNPSAARIYEPKDSAAPRVPRPWAPNAWALWQYSGNGGKPVPGVGVDCDRNVFNGTVEELRARLVLDPGPALAA